MKKPNRIQTVWWHVPAAIRKPLVLMVGSAVIVAGLAMLILPGPGWAAIFLGFAVLATEFAFAERIRDWLYDFIKILFAKTKQYLKSILNIR